jgi:hypothetical protein
MEIILIQRQRGKDFPKKKPNQWWLAWIGTEQPSLMSLWSLYLKRFAIEHWESDLLNKDYIGQKRNWEDTESGQRWSNLMPILTWQLWLARENETRDNPLPVAEALTPGEVNPRTSGIALCGTFSRDRHTRQTTKTPRKVPRLGKG